MLSIKGRSKLSKEEMERVIGKVKFKDASSQIMGPYCMPCVEMAQKVNLEIYIKSLSRRSYAHDGNIIIDKDTGEVIGKTRLCIPTKPYTEYAGGSSMYCWHTGQIIVFSGPHPSFAVHLLRLVLHVPSMLFMMRFTLCRNCSFSTLQCCFSCITRLNS